jgi:cobalt-zinc-cadmium efflux system protein
MNPSQHAVHAHPGHNHAHDRAQAPVRVLWLAVGLTLGFALIEAAAGWWSGALVLLGDAAHMITDAFALGLAAVAALLAQRPADQRHSFGFGRVEMLGALLNAVLMLIVVAMIAYEAVIRMQSPPVVNAQIIAWVALIGLLVNIGVARLLWPAGESSINVRGALLHVMGDILGSIVALVTGVVLLFADWYWLDPVLSLLICGLIGFSALGLLREAVHQLLDGVPLDLDLEAVRTALNAIEGVEQARHVHIWRIHGQIIGLTAELAVREASDWERILHSAQDMMHERFHIDHATLQPSFGNSSLFSEKSSNVCSM